jgi:hypothetical protein
MVKELKNKTYSIDNIHDLIDDMANGDYIFDNPNAMDNWYDYGFVRKDVSNGDILQIDRESGQVLLNNEQVDFSGGFPKYTLTGNSYIFTVVGQAYDIDIKFKYYKLWL